MDRSREESHPEAVRWGEGRVGVKEGEEEREKEGGREGESTFWSLSLREITTSFL